MATPAKMCARCQHPMPDGKFKCPSCLHWNVDAIMTANGDEESDGTVTLDKVKAAGKDRMRFGPWDPLWGKTKMPDGSWRYGIVRTSTTVIGGAPGAGKSTLLLQMCEAMTKVESTGEALYIATEEADEELKERSDRLVVTAQNRIRIVPAMSGEVNDLTRVLERRKPILILLDSLAGLTGEDLQLQITVCKTLKEYAVRYRAPVIMITHVTKGDVISGLMGLQHAVDTVMTFFPDERGIRTLEVMKNRNGRAFVSLSFKMTAQGLNLGLTADEVEELLDNQEQVNNTDEEE